MSKKLGKKSSLILKHSLVVLVMASTALIGVVALKGSFAATGGSYVWAEAVEINPSTGKEMGHLPGVQVELLTTGCTNYSRIQIVQTDATGLYAFGKCTALITCYDLDQVYKPGYQFLGYKVFTAGGMTSDEGGGCAKTRDEGTATTLFRFQRLPTPVTLNVSKTAITAGESVTLSWSAPGATYCERDGSWGKAAVSGGGSQNVTPSATSNYAINCVSYGTSYVSNGVGANSVTKTVTVSPKPVAQQPATQSTSTTSKTTTTNSTNTKPKTTPAAVASVVAVGSGDTAPPDMPANFKATLDKGKSSVSLKWDAAKDNVAVAKYLLERSTDAASWETLSDDADTTSYVDEKLPLSEENPYIYYQLRAQDAVGNLSEATSTDIENISIESSDSDETTDAAPVTDVSKSNGILPTVIKVGAGLLLLGVLVGGVAWYRRLGRNVTPEPYMPSTMPAQPQAPTVMPTPPSMEPPHASQSLKDMVMQDYHPGERVDPPQPPRQDPPYPPQS